MTDDEALTKYKEMEEYFGELPNFEHHPKQFAYYVRLYDYYKQRRTEDSL
jgi:hypothetical protein